MKTSTLRRLPVVGPAIRRLSEAVTRWRTYAAAVKTRLNATQQGLAAQTTGDQEWTRAHNRVSARSRQTHRNTDFAATLIDDARRRIIGPRGIWPQPKTKHANLNTDLTNTFREDAHCIGLRGETWAELSAIAVQELKTDGDAFGYTCVVPPTPAEVELTGDTSPRFRIALFESTDLTDIPLTIRLANGETFANGIRYDRYGRPLAYYIREALPGELGIQTIAPRTSVLEIPASRVFHVYRRSRPSNWRGMPPFAETVGSIDDIADADDAELQGQRQSAKFGLIIEQPLDSNGAPTGNPLADQGATDEAEADTNGTIHQTLDLEAGMVRTVQGKAYFLNPNRPGLGFFTYVAMKIRRICARFGSVPEHITGDHTGVNFSTARSAQLANEPVTEEDQELVIEKFCLPMYRAWLAFQAVTGRVRMRQHDVSDVMATVSWRRPYRPAIDEKQRAAARVLNLGLGVGSFSQFCAEDGLDPREQVAQIIEDENILKAAGLTREKILLQAGALAAFAQTQAGQDGGEKGGGSNANASTNVA